jgi:hypothetical protein
MKIVFNIQVGIDVPSYVQAGEVLDKITRHLDETVGPKGSYDVSNFQARHRPIHEFADQAMTTEGPMKMEREY